MLSAVFVREALAERAAYEQRLRDATVQTMDYIEQSLSAAVKSCNTLFSARWYWHYRNVSGIYDDEFDLLRQKEVQDDLIAKIIALEAVTDILIITPSLDSVICKNGWYGIGEYTGIYHQVAIDAGGPVTENPAVTPADDGICTLVLEDINNRRDKTVICLLISKSYMKSFMERVRSGDMAYVAVSLGGQSLYEYGQRTGGQIVNTASAGTPALELTVASPRYEDSLMTGRLTTYILLMVIVLLSSALLAFAFTRFTYRPLRQILNRFIKNDPLSGSDPYRSITQYVESVSQRNRQLSAENANLNESMDNFLSVMRNELMMAMVTNEDFDFQDEYITSVIPWINDGLPYILALLEPLPAGSGGPAGPEDLGALEGEVRHLCRFPILDGEVCLILWFESGQAARERSAGLYSRLEQMTEERYHCAMSPVLLQPEDMRCGFLALRAEISDMKKAHWELPISLQIGFMKSVQSGRWNQCAQILDKARASYPPGAFLSLLLRVASESRLDASGLLRSYHRCSRAGGAEAWDVLAGFTREVCRTLGGARAAAADETPAVICRFIRDNYSDPNMSVKLLSDKFSMHRTLISKLIKARTGISFGSYLMEMRMKKAMELLVKSDTSITAIAERVGYVNYTTFKRAFIRYQGVTPRGYRDTAGPR